jgi:hypothetical protein
VSEYRSPTNSTTKKILKYFLSLPVTLPFPPDTILIRLLPAAYWPISTEPSPLPSIDFLCGLLSLSSSSYIAGCFRLVVQSAATCSRWFLACRFVLFSSTLKMEAIRSSGTLVYTRSTRRHIPEDGMLHSHRRENLKFHIKIFSPFQKRGIKVNIVKVRKYVN